MDLLNNLLNRFYKTQAPAPSRHVGEQRIYTVEILDEVLRFVQHHKQVAMPGVSEELEQEYVASLVEQMIAHFEYQETAVQSFVGHYTAMITANISPGYQYHPLRYIRQMEIEGYQQYVYWLYGFAEDIYKLFVAHNLFTPEGKLMASYQGFQLGTLYLIIRPEVPDVFM